jgi:hypothetical protein
MKNQLKSLALLAVWSGVLHLVMMMPGGPGTITASAEQGDIVVRVLLYSGQPDPAYNLDNEEAIEAVREALSSAKVSERYDKETVIPSILGYKGILVTNPEKREGLPDMFAVYHGMIEVSGEQKRFLLDENRRLEKMLIDGAMKKDVIDDVFMKSFRESK